MATFAQHSVAETHQCIRAVGAISGSSFLSKETWPCLSEDGICSNSFYTYMCHVRLAVSEVSGLSDNSSHGVTK
jgi:hypothetical protein